MQVALCDQIRQKAFDLHGYLRSQQIRCLLCFLL